jgi:HK97 family phage major capsid protein
VNVAHINELRDQFAEVDAELSGLLDIEEPTEEQRARVEELDARAEELTAEIEKAKVREDRKAKFASIPTTEPVAKPEPRVEVTKNEATYRQDKGGYFRDLVHATMYGDADSRDRLIRNNLEVRDLTRTDTSSVGEFVPPAWLLELYQPGIRAQRRVTANLVRSMALPSGTDSINIPRISTNPTVAAQTADNQTVNEVDAVSATVNAPVVTFAGQNDVALQVLDQSPISGGFDQVIFDELIADLDRYVDVQVLNGTGANGQFKGIVPVAQAGSQKVAYTDASPTVPELYPSFGKVISLVTTARKDAVEAIVMHPRRWYWLSSSVDGSNRAYVLPIASGPNNAYGTGSNNGIAEGPVGQIFGVPVYLDPNVPVLLTNGAGAAGTEDIILAGKFSDAILMESNIRTRVLPEVLSGTLTVRLQAYEYGAFTAERAGGTGFGSIYDTGMAAPSGF